MEGAGKVAWGVQDRISGFWLWGGAGMTADSLWKEHLPSSFSPLGVQPPGPGRAGAHTPAPLSTRPRGVLVPTTWVRSSSVPRWGPFKDSALVPPCAQMGIPMVGVHASHPVGPLPLVQHTWPRALSLSPHAHRHLGLQANAMVCSGHVSDPGDPLSGSGSLKCVWRPPSSSQSPPSVF